MNNIFKMVEKHFAKTTFSIFCFSALVFAFACKNPTEDNQGKGNGGQQTQADTVSVEVKRDLHVSDVNPKEFNLKKGETLGLSALQKKLTIEFDDGYELGKISYGDNENGVAITDAKPHAFNEKKATIYISSQEKSDKPILTSLRLGGAEVSPISEKMNAGKTNAEKVLVEATYSPSEAKIKFEIEAGTPLDPSNNWMLKNGKNVLTITIEKGSDSKVYKVELERVDVPILKKITVGEEIREGAYIEENMTFNVPDSTTEIDISFETEPESATVECQPSLEGNTLKLQNADTTFKAKVVNGDKTSEYNITVKKISPIVTVLDNLIVGGNTRCQGKYTGSTESQVKDIIAGNAGVVVDIAGDTTTLIFTSSTVEWKEFKINGESKPVEHWGSLYKSMVRIYEFPIGARGEVTPIEVFADCNENGSTDQPRTTLRFNIKRMEELADITVDTLIIKEKNLIDTKEDPQIFVNLQNPQAPKSWVGTEPTLVELQCEYDLIKSVKIDGQNVEIKDRKDKNGEVLHYYVEHNITGVKPRGKKVHIEIEPKNPDVYSTLHWYFSLLYQAVPNQLTCDFILNGKHKSKHPNGFGDGIENNSNPTVDLDGISCNIVLYVLQRVKSVTMNGTACSNILRVRDPHGIMWSRVTGSVPLSATQYDQLTIVVEPYDKGAFKTRTIKFQPKGTTTPEEIKPVFESISGDANLKKDFLDNLTTTSTPTHKVVGSSADIEISLSDYEYEFLCNDGVYFNDEKVTLRQRSGRYVLVRKIPVTENDPVLCKVEFKSKAGMSKTVTWNFNVQGGGVAPVLPLKRITHLRLNRFGTYGKKFHDKDFKQHLLEGPEPEFKFDGDVVSIEIGDDHLVGNPSQIKEVVFKVEGATPEEVTVQPKKDGTNMVASHVLKGLKNTAGYKAQIIVKPKNEQKFQPLVLKLKLVPTGKKLPPLLRYYVNDKKVQEDYPEAVEVAVEGDKVAIKVALKDNELEKVYIGEKKASGNTENSDLKELVPQSGTDSTGSTFYYAEHGVTLTKGQDKIFIVRVIPIDKTKYEPVIDAEIILKGK